MYGSWCQGLKANLYDSCYTEIEGDQLTAHSISLDDQTLTVKFKIQAKTPYFDGENTRVKIIPMHFLSAFYQLTPYKGSACGIYNCPMDCSVIAFTYTFSKISRYFINEGLKFKVELSNNVAPQSSWTKVRLCKIFQLVEDKNVKVLASNSSFICPLPNASTEIAEKEQKGISSLLLLS